MTRCLCTLVQQCGDETYQWIGLYTCTSLNKSKIAVRLGWTTKLIVSHTHITMCTWVSSMQLEETIGGTGLCRCTHVGIRTTSIEQDSCTSVKSNEITNDWAVAARVPKCGHHWNRVCNLSSAGITKCLAALGCTTYKVQV